VLYSLLPLPMIAYQYQTRRPVINF